MPYKEVFENNKKWIEQKIQEDPNFFKELYKEQSPDYLYIGCSDSRVPANQIMGLEVGEVFVHRNIANMVMALDLNAMGVVEYAVNYLQVKHIIICGHYDCGGIKAAMESKDMGVLNPWLRSIRDIYFTNKKELGDIPVEKDRINRLAELNVLEQCRNVVKCAVVQKEYYKKSYPIVHGWIFDLSTGKINDLGFDFHTELKNRQELYNLEEE